MIFYHPVHESNQMVIKLKPSKRKWTGKQGQQAGKVEIQDVGILDMWPGGWSSGGHELVQWWECRWQNHAGLQKELAKKISDDKIRGQNKYRLESWYFTRNERFNEKQVWCLWDWTGQVCSKITCGWMGKLNQANFGFEQFFCSFPASACLGLSCSKCKGKTD